MSNPSPIFQKPKNKQTKNHFPPCYFYWVCNVWPPSFKFLENYMVCAVPGEGNALLEVMRQSYPPVSRYLQFPSRILKNAYAHLNQLFQIKYLVQHLKKKKTDQITSYWCDSQGKVFLCLFQNKAFFTWGPKFFALGDIWTESLGKHWQGSPYLIWVFPFHRQIMTSVSAIRCWVSGVKAKRLPYSRRQKGASVSPLYTKVSWQLQLHRETLSKWKQNITNKQNTKS